MVCPLIKPRNTIYPANRGHRRLGGGRRQEPASCACEVGLSAKHLFPERLGQGQCPQAWRSRHFLDSKHLVVWLCARDCPATLLDRMGSCCSRPAWDGTRVTRATTLVRVAQVFPHWPSRVTLVTAAQREMVLRVGASREPAEQGPLLISVSALLK